MYNRPGNYWSYLMICAAAAAVAYREFEPIGLQVASVFQTLVDALKLHP
jgi:hypothetical protein